MTNRKSAARAVVLVVASLAVPLAGYLAWELRPRIGGGELMPATICGLTAIICAAMPVFAWRVKPASCGTRAEPASK